MDICASFSTLEALASLVVASAQHDARFDDTGVRPRSRRTDASTRLPRRCYKNARRLFGRPGQRACEGTVGRPTRGAARVLRRSGTRPSTRPHDAPLPKLIVSSSVTVRRRQRRVRFPPTRRGTSGAATTNQDACRDLSGRRIRHVEAEKKLREHARNAPQRELEAAALKHINSKGNQIKRKFQEIEEREKERYANESGAVIGNVEDAVLIGVAAERKNESQQKKSELDAKSKKPVHTGYMGLGLGGVSDDSDDSDEDMEKPQC